MAWTTYFHCTKPEVEYSGMVDRFVEDLLKIQNFANPKVMTRPGGSPIDRYDISHISSSNAKKVIIYAGGYLHGRSILTEDNYPRWVQVGRSENYGIEGKVKLAEDMIQMGLQDWITHTEIRYNFGVAKHDFCVEMRKTKNEFVDKDQIKDQKIRVSQIEKLLSALKKTNLASLGFRQKKLG